MSETLSHLPLQEQAVANFKHFSQMKYPGRFIVMGKSDSGQKIEIYGIMGRSDSSRSRYFVKSRDGIVTTQPLDKSKPYDPLTIYPAMREQNGIHIVTNGRQTNYIMYVAASSLMFDLSEALEEYTFESDPSHTPRISAVDNLGELQFSILREDPNNPDHLLEPKSWPKLTDVANGIGYQIQTYVGDGSTDSYMGIPIPMPLNGSPMKIADTFWNARNAENRVGLVVKEIDPKTNGYRMFVRNKLMPQNTTNQRG